MTIDSTTMPDGSATLSDQTRQPVSRMRVFHLIKHCGYANGSVHVAVDLACVQAQAGDDVTVISA